MLEEAPIAAWNPRLVGQRWSWSCTAPEMADSVGVGPWSTTLPRSPEQEQEPREEVVQAPPAPPVWQGPRAHLWQPPPHLDLTSDDDDDDSGDGGDDAAEVIDLAASDDKE